MWKLSQIINNTDKEIMINYDVLTAITFSSVIPDLGSLSILIPDIGILYCEDIGSLNVNPPLPQPVLGVLFTLNEKQWMFKYMDDLPQFGPGTISITINEDGTLTFESVFEGLVKIEALKSPLDKKIELIKLDYEVSDLVVDATLAEIELQSKLPNNVSFLDALNKGIASFLYDGKDIESPFSYIKNDPGSYGLPNNPDDDTIIETIRNDMNRPASSIILLSSEYRFLPERGERVEDNWIFRFKPATLSSDLHWVIIDRQGIKPTINYGFS